MGGTRIREPAVSAPGPKVEGLVFLETLGRNGYSDVFLYERTSPRMRVAVKVLKTGRLGATERAQFAAQAEAMAELANHPYVVQLFSTGELIDGRPYLVMQYFPHPNLGERVMHERLSVPEVLRTGVKVASAVETAHRAGILHRDIKPANILISQYGEPGLSDFGVARQPTEPLEGVELDASISWVAPEVLSGASSDSPQSDVYSLAATVWHLLVGHPPFEVPSGDNEPSALLARSIHTPPPKTGRTDVPALLERLLAQAMAKDPNARPATALEFANGLQAVEQEQRIGRTDILVAGLRDEGSHSERRHRSTRPARQIPPVRVREAIDDFVRLIGGSPPREQQLLVDAVAAVDTSPDSIGLDEDLWGPAPTSAEVRAAELSQLRRRFADRARIAETALSRDQAADLLGVTAQAITDYLTKGALVGLKTGRTWILPSWEFDADLESGIIPGIAELRHAFPGGVVSLTKWVTRPSADLDDRTPRDALADGDIEKVISLAASLSAAGW